jgi:hypothetical protein
MSGNVTTNLLNEQQLLVLQNFIASNENLCKPGENQVLMEYIGRLSEYKDVNLDNLDGEIESKSLDLEDNTSKGTTVDVDDRELAVGENNNVDSEQIELISNKGELVEYDFINKSSNALEPV